MVFKSDQNYQNTSETFVKQLHEYVNFQKLLNYQWRMMYMILISFFDSTCIFELSKTTKLPMKDCVNVSYFLFQWFLEVTKTTKIPLKHSSNKYMPKVIFKNYQTTNECWCKYFIFPFLMVFKSDQNYQNTSETFVKQLHEYVNFRKLLNYQWLMMYMIPISFFDSFQKWSKLPKYLWNIRQKCICIHEFWKTTKLSLNDGVNVSNFLFNGFQMWIKLPKYLWKIRQTSTCIFQLSKTTKLQMNDDVYVWNFIFQWSSKVIKTSKIPMKHSSEMHMYTWIFKNY